MDSTIKNIGGTNLKTWCINNNRHDLIEQWSYKNEKSMEEYCYASHYKALWCLSYDDPKTGKHFDFEWEQEIRKRTTRNYMCPYLSGNAVWVGFNDLKTWCIQNKRNDLIEQWSPKNEKPMEEYCYASHYKALWCLSYDDPKTGNHFDFEWKQGVKDRTILGVGCPYLSGKAVWVGFNDLKTCCINNNRHDLIEQWSPKNEKPMEEYCYASHYKALWCLSYDDPKTGNHFDFEWKQGVKDRTILGLDCPYLSGKAVWVGFNDLVSTFPEIAIEWHPLKNGDKQPCEYSYGCHDKVWWHKTYIDPVTHTITYFEWEQAIKDRTIKNYGCPMLSASYMEQFTYKYLLSHKINFKTEHKVDGLGNKRFDIFIPNMNKVIELDGIQHFTDSKKIFECGDTPFEKRVQYDNMKNTYCKTNHIDLLRIPYVFGKSPDNFRKILDDFIINNIINTDIVEYYKQFEFSNYIDNN